MVQKVKQKKKKRRVQKHNAKYNNFYFYIRLLSFFNFLTEFIPRTKKSIMRDFYIKLDQNYQFDFNLLSN